MFVFIWPNYQQGAGLHVYHLVRVKRALCMSWHPSGTTRTMSALTWWRYIDSSFLLRHSLRAWTDKTGLIQRRCEGDYLYVWFACTDLRTVKTQNKINQSKSNFLASFSHIHPFLNCVVLSAVFQYLYSDLVSRKMKSHFFKECLIMRIWHSFRLLQTCKRWNKNAHYLSLLKCTK